MATDPQIVVLLDHPRGPSVLCPVSDPGAVEDALPDGWTVGDYWWSSSPEDQQPDGRWLLRLERLDKFDQGTVLIEERE
jgi:hypothetical protein